MSHPEYYGGPDWWGRFFSIGALCVAVAAVYLVYEQRQQSLPREEQLNQFNAGMDQWQQLATTEIAAIRSAGEEAIASERTRMQQLYAELKRQGRTGDLQLATENRPVDDETDPMDISRESSEDTDTDNSVADPNGLFARDSTSDPSGSDPTTEGEAGTTEQDLDASLAQNDDESVADDQPSLPLAMGPKLMVVRRAMRVTDDQLSRALVANSGNEVAEIREVYFVPMEEVRILAEIGKRPDESAQVARVAFGRTDNSSTLGDAHGAYRRVLSEPLRIAPGDEVEIDIEIGNRDHRGWGLLGELTLIGDKDQLTLEQTTAIFRDVSSL